MSFDLDAADVRPRAQEGVEMRLIDPAGRPTSVVLLVRGSDCQAYNDVMRAQIRTATDRLRKSTEDERNAEFYELNATLIAGWSGMTRGGAPFEYSPANAAKLLEDYSYIFEQVRRFADNRAHFLPRPASS